MHECGKNMKTRTFSAWFGKGWRVIASGLQGRSDSGCHEDTDSKAAQPTTSWPTSWPTLLD